MDPSWAERLIAEQRAQNELLLKLVDSQAGIIEEMRSQSKMMHKKMDLQDGEIERLGVQVDHLKHRLHDAMITLYYTQRELDASNAELRRMSNPLQDTTNLQENRRPVIQAMMDTMEFCGLGRREDDGDATTIMFRCSRCKSAVYTNEQEQIADWPRHREVCTPYREQLSDV